MKRMFFSVSLCLLFLSLSGSAFAVSEHDIREAYRSHFHGEKLTKEQKAMVSELTNEQKAKYYREALRESISERKRAAPKTTIQDKLDEITKEQERVKKMPKQKFVF